MTIKESNLTVLASSDLAQTDLVRVLKSGASRSISVTDFITAMQDGDLYVSVTGDTMTGNLLLTTNSSPTIQSLAVGNTPATISITAGIVDKSTLNLGDTADASIGRIEYDNIDNSMSIVVNDSEAIGIVSNGNVTLSDNLTVTGTSTLNDALTVTGSTTLVGTLSTSGLANLNGGIAVDTNAFTVADTTGDTSIAGTLDVTGTVTVPTLNVTGNLINMATQETPLNSSSAGTTGDIHHDTNYIYICVDTNVWKRVSMSTW